MPIDPVVMPEIVDLPRTASRRFLWILPAWFAVGALVGSTAAGHGGQLFFLGALAGLWASALLPAAGDGSLGVLPTLLGGLPVMLLLGWLLDRMGGALWLWVTAAATSGLFAGYLLLQGHADLEAAVAHHGSLLAYAVCALQLGAYAATLVVLGVQAGRGGRRAWE